MTSRSIIFCGSEEIRFPVSLKKTFWGSQLLAFLGFLLDMVNKRVRIPVDKVVKALTLIEEFLSCKKTTVRKIQKLCGFLNFLCRAIPPGHAFMRRLYAMYANKQGQALKPHHHIRVKMENKLDRQVWTSFLRNSKMFTRAFVDFTNLNFKDIRLYSDTSRNFKKGGFGALCDDSWLQGFWEYPLLVELQPSIKYLELFALMAGILAWLKRYKNSNVRVFCDNESVCYMVNTSSSKCKHCMVLTRLSTHWID